MTSDSLEQAKAEGNEEGEDDREEEESAEDGQQDQVGCTPVTALNDQEHLGESHQLQGLPSSSASLQ